MAILCAHVFNVVHDGMMWCKNLDFLCIRFELSKVNIVESGQGVACTRWLALCDNFVDQCAKR